MKTLKRRTIGLSIGFLSMLLLILVCATSAFADGGGNLGVSGGTLGGTITDATFYSNSGLTTPIANATLTGADQTIYFKLPVKVVDATGTGAGWTAKIYGTAFSDGGSHTLDTPTISAFSTVSADADSSPLNGTSNDSARGTASGSLGADSGHENTILTAATGGTYGMGNYTVNVTLAQPILASAFATTYTATYTLDVA